MDEGFPQRSDRVRVIEPGLSPWEGDVLSVKPSKKHGWFVEIRNADGIAWSVPIEYVSVLDKGCPSGKVRFPDQRAALDELATTITKAINGERNRLECRTYPCSSCQGWHLTSQPKRDIVSA